MKVYTAVDSWGVCKLVCVYVEGEGKGIKDPVKYFWEREGVTVTQAGRSENIPLL